MPQAAYRFGCGKAGSGSLSIETTAKKCAGSGPCRSACYHSSSSQYDGACATNRAASIELGLSITPFEIRYQSPAPIRISSLPSSAVLILCRVPKLGTSRSSSAKNFIRYSATSIIWISLFGFGIVDLDTSKVLFLSIGGIQPIGSAARIWPWAALVLRRHWAR